MHVNHKLLAFYLALSPNERNEFELLVGTSVIREITNPLTAEYLLIEVEKFAPRRRKNSNLAVEKDNAVMEIVRHVDDICTTNFEFAELIQKLFDTKITRIPKRSRTELQGMLLDNLDKASRDKLLKMRDYLLKDKMPKNQQKESNLENWFNIILGGRK